VVRSFYWDCLAHPRTVKEEKQPKLCSKRPSPVLSCPDRSTDRCWGDKMVEGSWVDRDAKRRRSQILLRVMVVGRPAAWAEGLVGQIWGKLAPLPKPRGDLGPEGQDFFRAAAGWRANRRGCEV